MPPTQSHPQRFAFPRRMRLSGSRQIQRVYAGKVRASVGPLLIYAIPNELAHLRIGFSVPRAVGTAVRRNLIKRRLREAFRLSQHEHAVITAGVGYDLVINVRAHEPLPVTEYQLLLLDAVRTLHKTWQRKRDNS